MSLNPKDKIDKEIKINSIQIGDYGVGKTHAVKTFMDEQIINIEPTVGLAFCQISLKVREDNVKFNLHDTSGQEKYISLTKSFIRKAQGIAIFYDVTDRNTFKHVEEIWKRRIDQIMEDPTIPIILIANKIDKEDRQVTTEEGALLAYQLNYHYFETSAVTGEGITDVFNRLAELIIEHKYVDRYIFVYKEDFKYFDDNIDQSLIGNRKYCKCCH